MGRFEEEKKKKKGERKFLTESEISKLKRFLIVTS